ncbi:hypothetical protein M0657_001238 [Pyricularia oryzae]|uniref:Cyclin-D1-binding protein 1-like N-terminal domain-containing protein n=1 Tax=Pyricularia oryzae (strain Y34) TaxID=1143189 RepID=A0AA97NVA8_PYRO3|nr:hypothetical protein OOU_Y34scaffold00624g92 [Pyricularia oryzae Y34]KAI7923732.1 hypothetical protein M9X92_004181 [Pyricularia oryzae]KAI7931284.1 hypothetical protein M0657_001238 [Pyricularia oryzae]
MPSSAAPGRAANDVGSLRSTIETADTVVRQSIDILDGLSTVTIEDRPELDVVALARDSAALVRAHTTKISLLVINEPFTPSAISKVLRELIGGPVPSLVSAAQLCVPSRYTGPFRDILVAACRSALHALRDLVQIIPTNGKALSDGLENGTNSKSHSLQVTGIVWNRCDEVKRLADKGIAGCLVEKVERYRDELKDVMEELKEWGEETGESDEDDDASDFDGPENKLTAAQDMLDDIMNSHSTIPADDPDKIRERLESCLRRLRLMTLLYQAINKRRLKTLPKLPTSTPCADLDRVGDTFRILGGMIDGLCDVADAFYGLDKERIDLEMKEKFGEASKVAELLRKPWGEAETDEFTEWAKKFQEQITKS